jgi:2-polyprenyl-6-methoxyphenol hydroxylase-like FAD-dependent oxidoreductase
MTLALELARHGVRSILVERNPSTTRHPKMDLTNGRSMELYRRLGLSERLRAAGVPERNPFDIIWATSPTGYLLHRFAYPSAAQRRQQTSRFNDGTGTAEPGLRISQIILEPVLRQSIGATGLVDAHSGWKFERLDQNATGVTSIIVNCETNESREIRTSYLVGCDGGGSRVRRSLGIGLEGNESVGRVMMIHFKSEDRAILNPWGIAWHLQTGLGSLVAQDDTDTWTLHCPLPPTDEEKLDPAQLLRRFVGRDFRFQILLSNIWTPKLVVAERYIGGRVILAGDAAHQFIPTGGYGMNTGVGDAVDLGWKLSTILNGWGGEALLESYELERRQIARQNREASQAHFDVRVRIAEAYARAEADGPLEEAGAAGDARRAKLGAAIAAIGNAENECWGIEHGYRYEESAVLSREGEIPPPFGQLACIPTTVPGARLPHIRLAEGTALMDRLGPEFTLLVIGDADDQDFRRAAVSLGIPLAIVHLADEPALELLERKLLLIRPDQHVAWRGDTASGAKVILLRATGSLLQAM